MDCHDRVQTKIKHLNGTGHVGSKLTGEIFSLNNASSLWWVRRGKKIAASISSVRSIWSERYNATTQ